MATLKISGLSKSFGIKTVFENVSFDVRSGERIGLVGANGAGKTTLLKCSIGTEEYDKGSVKASDGAIIGSCERGILRGRVAAADLEACEQGVRIERSRTVALQQSGELCDQAVEQLRLVMVEPQAQSALRKGEQSHCAPACRTVAHNP